VSELDPQKLLEAIWERDPTVWTGHDEAKWLGWLDEPARMRERVGELEQFAQQANHDFESFVLLGMGGSSLAPEVFRQTFGAQSLHVLDTTHPKAIRALESSIEPGKTLFISASKSGTTLETRSHTDYFWEKTGKHGTQFAAITDPGSALEKLARERGFRAVFAGEPTIGGRYSALSPFGLVAAALANVDVRTLLERAVAMVEACRGEDSPGLELGFRLGQGWQQGQDKVCINPNEGGFGLWAEQLLAESTGKEGKGLIPAPGEEDAGPDCQPGEVELDDSLDLGAEFFRWEFATAVAGAVMQINPFDQPNVQEAKDRTNAILEQGDAELDPESSAEELFAQAKSGDYVCIQAFVEPNKEVERTLDRLVGQARGTGCVVTHGYGPRYLHSTGQLHKGGPPTGLFLQVVDDTGPELPIPGRKFGFARLIRAQAAGDYSALKERGRRVARIRLEDIK
jgi:transaldolase/glucose-6-phosphate isomerase